MSLTAVILTFNEAKHIARCILSVSKLATRVVVVDSFSTDNTVALARSLGADVLQNTWKNYATQFQWALDNAGIESEWTMRIDADEYLEPELQDSIRAFVDNPGLANGVYFRRKMVFLGRPILHGFFYPAMMLRLWRTGQGHIEQRWMDEHIQVTNATTTALRGDLVDHNLNDLAWWTNKHVGYAKREAYDIVSCRGRSTIASNDSKLSGAARRKRWLKNHVYNKLPSGIRGMFYFFFRYVVGRGFLDGREGFYFHFLQAYWYRTFVDATLLELEREAAMNSCSALDLLKRKRILSD